ncbi:amidohydrolase 3 [Akanthomyces lecanii RCEF 1005]|uniref:Amidohydrolase 3 n=1 Tax=Akanthomyces lecanii RCEF 1005 TaxID=1081108 RepID=A0A162KM19_CORDF|nr:amidohydrolase 3 [Akanthomyces lecanii RCEF 1005]
MDAPGDKVGKGLATDTPPSDGRPSSPVKPPKGRYGMGTIPSLLVAVSLVALGLRAKYHHAGAGDDHDSQTYCYTGVQTLHSDQPVAQCFTVANGLFTAVTSGSEPELKRRSSEDTTTAAVDGFVIPGLWDGHGHLVDYGEMLVNVDLFGVATLDDMRARLRDHIAQHPGSGTKERWLRGIGWDQTDFGRMPTAADIEEDPALRGIYLFIDRIDGHCALVSQAVLDLLPDPIPDVPGGEVVRDPPGLGVFCDNALGMILAHYPKPDDATKTRYVKAAMRALNAVGLVGMHNAGTDPATVDLLQSLAGGDDWTVRVYAMRECAARNTFCAADATRVERDDGLLNVRSVKLFADGALGSWGAAMLEPYADDPSTTGSLLIDETALAAVTKQWTAAGFQVNIHAIGDRANRAAIDAFEAALRQECGPSANLATCEHNRRFRIEHAQIITPEDQQRLHSLRVIPSIQPTHATSDMRYAAARLGAERTSRAAYRMRSFLDLQPVLGSDFPVEPPNPFHGMYAAVARKSPATGLGRDEDGGKGWHREEALTLEQALWGFTGAPAYGGFLEGKAGQIREGAYADWVVLDEPFGGQGFDVESLRTLKVRETWVAGKRVYKRDD